jgi:hypothetical protein
VDLLARRPDDAARRYEERDLHNVDTRIKEAKL